MSYMKVTEMSSNAIKALYSIYSETKQTGQLSLGLGDN